MADSLGAGGIPSQVSDTIGALTDVLNAANAIPDIGVSLSHGTWQWFPNVAAGNTYQFEVGVGSVAVDMGIGTVGEVASAITTVTVTGIAVPLEAQSGSQNPPLTTGTGTVPNVSIRGANALHSKRISNPSGVKAKRISQDSAIVNWVPPISGTAVGFRIAWVGRGDKRPQVARLGACGASS